MDIKYENTHNVGDVGVAYAIARFIEYGIIASVPFSVNLPYDLIVDYKGKLFKIQIKTTEKIVNDAMVFYVTRTNPFKMCKVNYSDKEIDYFFLFCTENRWCGLINIKDCKSSSLKIHLRYPLNHQFKNYKMFDDYSFDRRIREITENKNIELISRHIAGDYKKEKNIKNEIITGNNEVTRNELKELIRNESFLSIGKKYNVCDNAVRKWCVKMGLPSKKYIINSYSEDEWKNL